MFRDKKIVTKPYVIFILQDNLFNIYFVNWFLGTLPSLDSKHLVKNLYLRFHISSGKKASKW